MSLSHSVVSLNSSTSVLINADTIITNSVTGESRYTWNEATLSIQNVDSSATVYVGGSGVSSSSYGALLTPGATISIDNLGPEMAVYAISSGSSNIALLMVTR